MTSSVICRLVGTAVCGDCFQILECKVVPIAVSQGRYFLTPAYDKACYLEPWGTLMYLSIPDILKIGHVKESRYNHAALLRA
jgi:hypothetical protein